MYYTMVSIDCGQNGAMAIWEEERVKEIKGWSFDRNQTLSQNICDVVDSVELIIRHHRPVIVVERPGRQMHIQWVMYNDIRQIAESFKVEFAGYVPTAIKKEVTGNGRAGKGEMEDHVYGSIYVVDLDWNEINEHKVDAVGIGICHLNKRSN